VDGTRYGSPEPERAVSTPPLLYQTSAFTRPGAMPLHNRTLLTRTQRIIAGGTAGNGDAELYRFNLLSPPLQTKKKAR
jgi:hypothetical protein